MATVKVRGEAVETHKMIKDNKLKRRSQEKKVSHPKEPGKLKTDELVNSKDCIFKRRVIFMFCFSQIRTSELNEWKELKMEHNLPIMEIFFQNPWNHGFSCRGAKKIASFFFFEKISGFSNSEGNLNNNLYFLLLGLGVDDAFVLTSEYLTHSREAKAKAGGVSSFSGVRSF